MFTRKIALAGLLTTTFAACGPDGSGWDTAEFGVAPPGHDAQFVNTNFPTVLNNGEKRTVRVTMQNNGVASPADDWLVASHYLRSTNAPFLEWRFSLDFMTTATPVGGSQDFFFLVTTPATTNANADFTAQMFVQGGGFYGDTAAVTGIDINPANPRLWDCSAVDTSNIPGTMAPGEAVVANIIVQNSGSGDWGANNFCFRAPDATWGTDTCTNLAAPVSAGANHTFPVTIRAPTTPGSYPFQRQMFGLGGVTQPWGIGYFDDAVYCVDQTIDVQVGGALAWDAQILSQNFPTTMSTGQTTPVTVRVRNTGTQTWTNTAQFFLYSQNNPLTLWGVVNQGINVAVPPGGEFVFTFPITAPATAGNYNHRWQMRGTNTTPPSDFFGPLIDVPVQVVAGGTCGNNVTESPFETCDDGNTTPGDGCDGSCLVEPQVLDTSVQNADRLFSANNMDNVEIGDFSGDAIVDVIVAQPNGVNAAGTRVRTEAGTVFGYTGGSTFFDTAATVAPTGASFQILGAEANDLLGGRADGRFVVGNIYGGGGPNDLVVSAPGADGDLNGRANAGEVYVFNGTSLTGFIDLAVTAPTARIIGPVAGGVARILDVGDANNDGFDDLLIGVPFDAPLGRTDAGAVYLVRGGPTLTGTIDLSTEACCAGAVLAVFQGQNAVGASPGDQLGRTGAIGNVAGNATNEVVLGAPRYSAVILRGGAAYAFLGPVSGTYDLATNYTTRWRGGDIGAGLGSDVAIGNVRGSNVEDVVLGGGQILSTAVGEPDSQRGGALVVEGGISGGDFLITKAGGYPQVASRVFGEEFGDTFATSVALGDLNGDGYMDLLCGAPYSDGAANGLPNSGAVSAVLGAQSMALTTDLAATPPAYLVHGPRQPSLLGRDRQGLATGDLDNDGRADFCVGVPNGGNEVYCVRSPW